MITDVIAALRIKKSFMAEREDLGWLWYSELQLSDTGYAIRAYVTDLLKADKTLPTEFGGMKVVWEKMRF